MSCVLVIECNRTDHEEPAIKNLPLKGYVFAALATSAVLLILKSQQTIFKGAPPLSLFLLAVVLVTWYGGFGAGFLAAALSLFMSAAFLIETPHGLPLNQTAEGLHLILLFGSGWLLSLGTALLREKLQEALLREEQLKYEIAERQHVERKLREREAFSHKVLMSSLNALYIYDVNAGTDSFINTQYTTLTGYTLDDLKDLTGAKFFTLFHPEDQKNLTTYRQALIQAADGEILENEYRFRTKDGRWIWCLSRNAVFARDGTGAASQFIGSFLDISARKTAEEQLAKQAQELARSNAELQAFAYVASHDLQEPLRAVAGCVEIIRRRYQGQLDARADEIIRHAVDGASRMQNLINDLLLYSRVGSRSEPFAPVDSQTALAAALDNLEVALRESGAQVTHDPLPRVTGDLVQLTQLFQNLIGNALKFRGERTPAIHIGAKRQNKEWVFSVRDNGIGIEPQYYKRIFQIFQRLHARNEYPGTGIGLAICKRIIERHDGRIWVESRFGEGAAFFFTLSEAQG
jgi:PAS domain S-box-containing protein